MEKQRLNPISEPKPVHFVSTAFPGARAFSPASEDPAWHPMPAWFQCRRYRVVTFWAAMRPLTASPQRPEPPGPGPPGSDGSLSLLEEQTNEFSFAPPFLHSLLFPSDRAQCN